VKPTQSLFKDSQPACQGSLPSTSDIPLFDIRHSLFCPFTPSIVCLRQSLILFLHIASSLGPLCFLFGSSDLVYEQYRNSGRGVEAMWRQRSKKHRELKHRLRGFQVSAHSSLFAKGLTTSLSIPFPPFSDPSSGILRVLFGKVRLYYEAVPKQTRIRPEESTPFGEGPESTIDNRESTVKEACMVTRYRFSDLNATRIQVSRLTIADPPTIVYPNQTQPALPIPDYRLPTPTLPIPD
jgi:hypothetical protein